MTTFAERYAEIDKAITEYNQNVQIACKTAEELVAILDQQRLALFAKVRPLGLKQRDVNARLGKFDWIHRPPAETPLDIPAIDAAVEAATETAIVHGDPFEIPPHLRKAPPSTGEG